MKNIEVKYIVYVIISIIIGGSILGYGYLDYKYKNEVLEQKMKSEEEIRLEKAEKQVNLQKCLDEVGERTSNVFKDNKKPISDEGVKFLLNLTKDKKEECFKKYK
jgi:hypothetical protein